MGTREITERPRTGTVAAVDARQRIARSPVADATAMKTAVVDVKRDQRGVAVTQCRDRLVDPNRPPRRGLTALREMTPLEAVLPVGSEATLENASEAPPAVDARRGPVPQRSSGYRSSSDPTVIESPRVRIFSAAAIEAKSRATAVTTGGSTRTVKRRRIRGTSVLPCRSAARRVRKVTRSRSASAKASVRRLVP